MQRWRLLARHLRTQARYENHVREDPGQSAYPRQVGIATPRQVRQLYNAGHTSLKTSRSLARPISRRICDRAGKCEEGALCSVRVFSIVVRASLPKYKCNTASSIITTESERISPQCKTTRRRPNGRNPLQMTVSSYLNIPVPFPTWFPSIHRSLDLPSKSSSIPDNKACIAISKAANTLVREKQCPSNVRVRPELICMQFLIVYPEALQDQACTRQMFSIQVTDNGSPGKTLLARTLASVLDVPFSVSDATAFTQVCLRIQFVVSKH